MPLSTVDAHINSALDATATAVGPALAPGVELATVARASALGGKRLRARLLLASFEAHAANSETGASEMFDAAAAVAAALELFQSAALVHDDLIDESDTRRGSPTVHRALEAAHRGRGGEGSARLGRSAAVLAGDLLLMASSRALWRGLGRLERGRASLASAMFADMAELCTAGQYLDLCIAAEPIQALADQVDDVLATMRSKTASYTAEFPLALGSCVADAAATEIAAMRDVGLHLGIAFQLRDDVLGLVGSPEVTGKPAGDDIREGKRTMLVVHAWSDGDSATRSAIAAALGQPEASPETVTSAVRAIVATGAVDVVETMIETHTESARAALSAVSVNGIPTSPIERLIVATTARDR